MKRLVEFQLEAGGSVFIEVETPTPEGMLPATPLSEVPQKAQQTFEAALDRVHTVAGAVLKTLHSLPESPDKIEVEFGIKMDAAAGAIVSTAGVEANFKIVLTWKKETPPPRPEILSSAP